MKAAPSKLKRPLHPMPPFVRKALTSGGLWKAYRSRPPFQQNDYIGWITRARREETRTRRLEQMLAELEDGTRYMKMEWRPAEEPAKGRRKARRG
jgi:hypothetical protein